MIQILPYFSAFIMIFGGGYLALLGFRIINPKKDNPEHREKMIKWHKKFGGFAKYGGSLLLILGVLNLIFPTLNPYNFDKKDVKREWSNQQKDQLMQQMINNLSQKQINQDTAKLVAKCFVDKYTTRFKLEDAWNQDTMPREKVMQLVTPIIKDCMTQYGIKTVN
jgi:hypothetical protein